MEMEISFICLIEMVLKVLLMNMNEILMSIVSFSSLNENIGKVSFNE